MLAIFFFLNGRWNIRKDSVRNLKDLWKFHLLSIYCLEFVKSIKNYLKNISSRYEKLLLYYSLFLIIFFNFIIFKFFILMIFNNYIISSFWHKNFNNCFVLFKDENFWELFVISVYYRYIYIYIYICQRIFLE